jgi:thioredoxin-like negative regulator of GroEL
VNRSRLAAVVVLAMLACALVARRAHPAASPAPVTSAAAAAPEATVIYYYIPGCTVCARTSQRLAALVARYPGRVTLRRVDCTSDEGVAAVARYGFRSHGLVLLDRAARAQLVESDHRVFPEHVAEALARILPAAPPR